MNPQPSGAPRPGHGTNGAAYPARHRPGGGGGAGWLTAYPLQRLVGVLLTVGGLWHAAAPWIFTYSDVPAAVASNLASGLGLAAAGVAFVALRGPAWLDWACVLIGAWVLFAPHILGFAARGFAANEALWGGLFTVVLAGIAAADRWLGRPGHSGPAAGHA